MNTIKKISVPASKSYLQRALAIAALAEGESILKQISWCDDTLAARNIIEHLGCYIQEKDDSLIVFSRKLTFEHTCFNASESGLSMRMFSSILALSDKEITFTGEGSLLKRPVGIIADALTQLGANVETNKDFLPIKIKGRIKPNKIIIDGSLSSQLLTGLLITLPLLDGDSEIIVNNLKSTPYIDMTLSAMSHFGIDLAHQDYRIFKIKGKQKYKATSYNIEGDWSAGAFFLVYGAIKGVVEVSNLDMASLQADKAIIEVLDKVGAKLSILEKGVRVEKNKLNAFEFDISDSPDLFFPLACLASQCNGTSKIKGVSRLKYKESNRVLVLKNIFIQIGISVNLEDDIIFINGGKIKGAVIDSYNDHRVVMLGAIMNLLTDEKIVIKNKEAVAKSYPDFFKDLAMLE